MPEPRYLLMALVADESPRGARFWAAVGVSGVGKVLTREQAEVAAPHSPHRPCFLLAYTPETAQFADDASRTMAMLPGESIWHYGEPARVELMHVLMAVGQGAPVLVSSVLHEAEARFGPAADDDKHDVEAAFDALVMHIGGHRGGDPPAYVLPAA